MALTNCTVSGTLKDSENDPIIGSVVVTPSTFGITDADNSQVELLEKTTDCNSIGEWSIDLVQSAMFETPVTYQFEFRDADGNFLYREAGKTIPAETSEDYNDL